MDATVNSYDIVINEQQIHFMYKYQALFSCPVSTISKIKITDQNQVQLTYYFKYLITIQLQNQSDCEKFKRAIEQANIPEIFYEQINMKAQQTFEISSLKDLERQNIFIPQPSNQQLADMVFGHVIPFGLVKYLQQVKPIVYNKDVSEVLIQKVQNKLKILQSDYIKTCKQQYIQLITQKDYDPLYLFDYNFENFYKLLEYHQEYSQIKQQSELTSWKDTEMFEDEEETETSTSTKNSQLNQSTTSTQSSKKSPQISKFFKMTIGKLGQKIQGNKVEKEQKKQLEDIQLDEIYTGDYQHGFLFNPTWWRINYGARQYLLKFIKNFLENQTIKPNDDQKYRISYINGDFKYSQTYPAYLVIPIEFQDQELIKAIKFRSKGRVPAVSYLYSNNASLTRCSQPGKGFGITREPADEKLLKEYADTGNGKLIVFDARPKLNAIGNRLTGKGFEGQSAYPFRNIHAVRDSFNAMQKLIQSKDIDQLTSDEIMSTKWYHHLICIMISCNYVAQSIINGDTSSMVHCSDGWDRTSQLSAGTMILIDPFYRTLEGFLTLIQKEWLDFGHMMATRCQQKGSGKAKFDQETKQWKWSSSNISQVFLQFIYCVFQLQYKYPDQFEFNQYLLEQIMKQLQLQNMEFAFDNMYQRTQHLLSWIKDSLFDQIIQNQEKYINNSYDQQNIINTLSYPSSYGEIKIFRNFWILK